MELGSFGLARFPSLFVSTFISVHLTLLRKSVDVSLLLFSGYMIRHTGILSTLQEARHVAPFNLFD